MRHRMGICAVTSTGLLTASAAKVCVMHVFSDNTRREVAMTTDGGRGRAMQITKLAVAAAIAVGFAGMAGAETKIWDGGHATSSGWGPAANWTDDVSPVFDNQTDLVFYQAGAARLTDNFIGNADRTIRSLTYNADADSSVYSYLQDASAGPYNLIFDADAGDAWIAVDADAAGNHVLGVAGGSIVLANNLVITHNGAGILTLGRPVTGAGLGITLNGSGTTILNAANTYDGPTAINGGTLIVHGDQSGATGAVTVGGASAAGTPTLGGTGTLGGEVTIAAASGGAAGTLVPGGVAAAGTLTVTTNLTLKAGAQLKYRLGTASDAVAGVANLALNGQQWGDFEFTAEAGFGVGTYVLIDAASVSGALGATTTGAIGVFDGELTVDGNSDVVLTVTLSKPTVTITQVEGQSDPANTAPINFLVTFSGNVSGFTADDVTLGGTASPSTRTVETNSAASYTVRVGGLGNDGTVTIAIAEDVVDGGNFASDPQEGDNKVTYDATAPTVTGIDDGDADDTVRAGEVLNYTVTFSEAMDVATVTAAAFTNAEPGAIAIGTITDSQTTPGEFTVPVTPQEPGSLVLQLAAGAVVKDVAGNLLATPVSDDTTVTVELPPSEFYVKTGGSDASSGTNWDEAFLTIAKAVNEAKSAAASGASNVTVYVGAGTFTTAAELFLDAPVAVIGGTQPGFEGQASVIRAPGGNTQRRVFNLSHAGARLDTLTIQDGYVGGGYGVNPGQGSNIRMTAGLVTNCVVQNGRTRDGSLQGGGIWMNGGTVADSVIAANQTWDSSGATVATSRGSGVYMAGGQLLRCLVRANYQQLARNQAPGDHCFGAGVFVGNAAAVVENCVIRNNVSSSGGDNRSRGAGLYVADGMVRHCTLVKNTQALAGMDGGGLYKAGAAGAVVNCVVASNTTAGVANDFVGDETGVTYSMAPELTDTLNGNIGGGSAVPVFTNYAANDFLLVYPSPGIDDGADVGVTDDINGDTRPIDGDGSGVAQADMGAYESPEVEAAFLCDFSVAPSPARGLNSLSVDFVATVTGPGSDSIDDFSWDFGDRATTGGATASNVTHAFGPGAFTVTLTVSNSLGAVTNKTIADVVQVLTNTVYVAAGAANRYPYNSWSNAASSFLDAVDTAKEALALGAEDATVYVSNGTFTVANSVALDQPISVIGQSSATSIIRATPATSHRVFSLTHGGARLEKIAAENGYVGGGANGAGVNMTTGTVVNCLIRGNVVRDGNGGGLSMSGGTVEWCVITNNYFWISSQLGAPRGGGAYVSGGVLRKSVITGNRGEHDKGQGAYGGGLNLAGNGIVESCLVVGNSLAGSADVGDGGGVYLQNGTLRNCTIVTNRCTKAAQTGGGVYQAGGTMVNTIVWGNTIAGVTGKDYYNGGTLRDITYSCAPELTGGAGNVTANPRFVDVALGDYRLVAAESPCVDAGLNESWMHAALDLDGNARVQGQVDMGAYETVGGPGGTVLIVR